MRNSSKTELGGLTRCQDRKRDQRDDSFRDQPDVIRLFLGVFVGVHGYFHSSADLQLSAVTWRTFDEKKKFNFNILFTHEARP